MKVYAEINYIKKKINKQTNHKLGSDQVAFNPS